MKQMERQTTSSVLLVSMYFASANDQNGMGFAKRITILSQYVLRYVQKIFCSQDFPQWTQNSASAALKFWNKED